MQKKDCTPRQLLSLRIRPELMEKIETIAQEKEWTESKTAEKLIEVGLANYGE